MRNDNSTPASFLVECAVVCQALSLYGAAGIAALGWALGCLIGEPTTPCLPLWFSAALLVFNADRLRHDPADALNVPARAAASARLRTASAVTLALAAIVLLGLPIWRREWLLVGLILAGSVISLGYSLPILGFRWKDVPLVKTLFAPTIVTLALFALPLLHHNGATDVFAALRPGTFLVPWTWCYLLFNMLLCDLRDLPGDAATGVRSIPVVFGEKISRRLLWALAVAGQLLLLRLLLSTTIESPALALLALLTGSYQLVLLRASRRPRSERFYEWAVEGLLYVPALACGLATVLLPDPADALARTGHGLRVRRSSETAGGFSVERVRGFR